MTLYLHPTLASQPGLASSLARELGGVWTIQVTTTGSYRCVLTPILESVPTDPLAAAFKRADDFWARIDSGLGSIIKENYP